MRHRSFLGKAVVVVVVAVVVVLILLSYYTHNELSFIKRILLFVYSSILYC